MTPRWAVLQAGAPSPVLNAGLAGFLERAAGRADVLGVHGGAAGLVAGRFRPVDGSDPVALAERPGAALGAGRHRPTGSELDGAVAALDEAGVRGIAVQGGNGTMGLAAALHDAAAARGTALQVVGIPKTVDNDLCGTDRSPGFLTAGRFVAHAVEALGADLRAMVPLERVRVVEVLGRDVGWLALAAALARRDDADAPHLVYTPEAPLVLDDAVRAVGEVVDRHGHALVVVAEGAAPELTGTEFTVARSDRLLRNGVVRTVADRVAEATGVGVRAEVLGMIQRSATWMAPRRDREDARTTGAAAAELLAGGHTGVLPGLEPLAAAEAPSTWRAVPLSEVAGRTRTVPYPLRPDRPAPPEEFRRWWERLVPETTNERTG